MIALFGEIALASALLFSLLQGVLPLWGYYSRNPYLLAAARPAALGQLAFVICAYILLTTAFGMNDFNIAYVADNSHPSLPLMYRLTAVWGAHEGSILLWVLVLNIWTLAIHLFSRNDRQQDNNTPLILAILGLISFCFLLFLTFTSNPFLLAQQPMSGHDLNPLLQDPGFVIHPPMLYTGYVGFSVAFACTLAGLLRGQLDQHWARMTRQFAVAAWCFLTLGITLGSWWAYRVLGWGGFWFWDPVENASLLPWIAGTALIHVLILSEKRGLAKNWAALLGIICFALSLLGTFLVRSGVLVSAHTFASDPKRGVFLLILLAILLLAALSIYIIRLPKLAATPSSFSLLSRETGLLLNSTILVTAMLTVLLGTLYPLIIDALHLGAVSVGAPYFNAVMTPLIFVLMFFMGFGPQCAWRSQALPALWQHTWKKLTLSFISAIVLLWVFAHQLDLTSVLSLSLSFWILLSLITSWRTLPGMSLAHMGFAILIIGLMLSSVLSQEREVRIKTGDITNLGPYQFLFIDTQGVGASNYRGIRATFDVMKNDRHVTSMHPEKRIYTVRDMVMTTVDIHPGIFRDLYIALGEPLDQDYWSVRIYYKPFIRWIWFGGLLMIMGGLLTLLNKNKDATT